jgi:hypothetical protein
MPPYFEPGARVSERWSSRERRLRWIAQGSPEATENPMIDERMAFVELVQKSGDGDFRRAVAQAVLQILIETESKR